MISLTDLWHDPIDGEESDDSRCWQMKEHGEDGDGGEDVWPLEDEHMWRGVK